MKVATVTIHKVNNYGSVLQSYATQTVFQRLGCEHVIINYLRPGLTSYPEFMNYALKHSGFWNKNFLTRKLYYLIKKPSYNSQERVFESFLKKNVLLSEETYYSYEDLLKKTPIADVYCTGSDQTWNCVYNGGFDPVYTLDFVNNNKKISFSASIGYANISAKEKQLFASKLKDYSNISVRESSAKTELESLGISNVIHTLDPTLVLNKKDWKPFIGERTIKEKYLLIYQLNPSKEFDQYAKEIAKAKGLKVVRVCNLYDHMFRSGKSVLIPTVSKWLSLINYAEVIVTDSFHGTAFSVNFNKQVFIYFPPKFNTRLDSIAKLLKIEDHVITNGFNISEVAELNYTTINSILERERKNTIDFLKKALR